MGKSICSSISLAVLFVFCTTSTAFAQKKRAKRKGEIYFSWGYNTEWYTTSNVHIFQPDLGNNYTLTGIKGHDNKGWNNQLFSKALTIPQYNYRLGYIFNKEKGWGIEINFDHTKFIISDQNAHIKGVLGGKPVDSTIAFNEANGFFYYLNNGANFLLFNIVKRWKAYASHDQKIKFDGLLKAGFGPVIPHVENSFFGQKNKPHFQLGGWNTGIEAGVRSTFFNRVYLEFTNKVDFAHYYHLKIYQGEARQAFGTYEIILSLGLTFGAGRKI